MLSGVYTLPSMISQLIFAILAGIGSEYLSFIVWIPLRSALLS